MLSFLFWLTSAILMTNYIILAVGECCKSIGKFKTDNKYNYVETGIDLSGDQSVVFKVRACNDAHIALSSSSDLDSNMYEIVIGGQNNTKSAIR